MPGTPKTTLTAEQRAGFCCGRRRNRLTVELSGAAPTAGIWAAWRCRPGVVLPDLGSGAGCRKPLSSGPSAGLIQLRPAASCPVGGPAGDAPAVPRHVLDVLLPCA